MPGLVGLVGLPSKHAAFSRTGTVPALFNNGTVFVKLRFHIGDLRRPCFLLFMFAEKYYVGRAFLIAPDWFTF